MTTKLGILIYEYVQPMDFIGPWEVFSFWKNVLKDPIEMYLISENGSYVKCDNEITVKAHYDFDHAPQLDYFIVPGGKGRLHEVKNEKLIAFIQKQAQQAKYLLSVCTGAFLVHEAGVLEGKSVTTYWRALPELKAFTDVKVVGERVVKNGNIWMSGGVSSGIDLAFALIEEIAGKETAGKVQLLFEYFPSDVLYAKEEMVSMLPPYNKENLPPVVPEYMKEYMEGKRKR